ncbi:MAG: hypothetical protein ACXW2E_00520 [Nitrososphaeraceae archaeon]
MHLSEWLGILYPLYNNAMSTSIVIQDWCGNVTPWSPSDPLELSEEDYDE